MKISRMIQSFGFFSLLLLLAGCSTSSVFTDFNPSFDRSRYTTYSWFSAGSSTGSIENPFFNMRVQKAIDRELAIRGYELKIRGPVDFLVDFHSRREVIATIYNDPVFYFPPRPYRVYPYSLWGNPQFWVRYHERNTLVIDITDARSNQPAWRGALAGVAREYANPDDMQEAVDRSVALIIDQFSPLNLKRVK